MFEWVQEVLERFETKVQAIIDRLDRAVVLLDDVREVLLWAKKKTEEEND